MSAIGLGCVKTQKSQNRRELFFSDQAKANTLKNSGRYNCDSEKRSFYRRRRPEGNVTGASLYGTVLGPKKLELLRELVPRRGTFGVLMNRGNPSSEAEADNVAAAAKAVGQEVHVIGASTEDEIEHAFETFANEKIAALIVATGAFFGTHTQSIVALAGRYALPAIYDRREFAAVGGLMSYGTRFVDVFRQAGVYVARILKGAKPADLPVLQPTAFELVINLKTAKALSLTVPQTLAVAADEVIE